MKHAVDDSLIYLTDDIIIQNYPNTVNARWHEVRNVDVIEKPQNDWSDSEICENRNIVRLQSVLHISPLKIISIKQCHLMC